MADVEEGPGADQPDSARTVVAIDLGASSGRVIAGTLADGRITLHECSRFPNRPVHVPRGDGEDDLQWDLLSLWQGIRMGLRAAAKLGPVESIGIDTWGVDYALLDAEGRLLGNPSCYRSSRTDDAVRRVQDSIGDDVLYARNGIQFQPFNTLYQLVADRESATASGASTLLMLPDLLGYWLTGRKACEVTNASTTGLLDPGTRAWDTRILDFLGERFGVDAGLLPELVEPGTVIGQVRLTRADLRTHAGKTTPVVAVGSHDTASAVVAVPARRQRAEGSAGSASFGFISSGTWSLVGVELNAPVRSVESREANFTNELGADGTVRYLKNIMGMWVQQECVREWHEQDRARSDRRHGPDWNAAAAAAESAAPLRTLVDINSPEFLPPDDMIERIARVAEAAGEPVPRDRGEYLRTITESLVVAYRRALREACELSGTSIDAVHIVGGGSKNGLLCQLTADATGLPAVAGPAEGTAMGNMVVQLRAVGALSGGLDDLRTVIADSVDTRRYEPVPGATVIWDLAEARVFGEDDRIAPLAEPLSRSRRRRAGAPAAIANRRSMTK
ncbi:MAG: rhamnulokinase family protein [Pseudoclavibacter sp.]